MTANILHVRLLGRQEYILCWQAMQRFTQSREIDTPDEVWLLEHPPVYTQGQNGKSEHILQKGLIPIVQTDRGGQVTYHGPGQLMVYTLIDLKRKKINIREFVTLLEQAVVDLLAEYGVKAHAKREAPGIYINGGIDKKIASLGLRVKRGAAYHGMALNINMDLSPFEQINPCGFPQLQMAQLADFMPCPDILVPGKKLAAYLMKHLNYLQVYYPIENK